MNIAIHQKESSKEVKVREGLCAALEPGETLQDYTLATMTTGSWSSVEYGVGLTDRRFILLQPRKPANVFSLWFSFIESVSTQASSSLIKRPMLQIQLSGSKKGDLISLVGQPANKAYLEGMAGRFAGWAAPRLQLLPQQVTRQAHELQKVGLLNQANNLLRTQAESNPILQNDPDVQALRGQIGDMRLAMRVAAVLYGLVILFMLLLAIMGQARVGMGLVLALLATVELVQGKGAARGAALVLSLLTVIANMVINLGSSAVDVIIWLAFGVSMLLLLTGKPGKGRTILATAIFVLGYIGPILLIFLMALIGEL